MTAQAQLAPFVILGLPRSRTAWLSYFLTYRDWQCLHDEVRHWRTLEDVRVAATLPQTGFAETSIAGFWRLIPKLSPDCRVVIVRRPRDEVSRSLEKLGCGGSQLEMWLRQQEAKLVQAIARLPNRLVIDYDSLSSPAMAKEIFEYCLPYPFDLPWFTACAAVNIQCNFRGLQRYGTAYKPALYRTAQMAKSAMLADLARGRRSFGDEIVMREEEIVEFFAQKCEAFVNHSAVVGEDLESFRTKNVPLMAGLQRGGNLRLLVARSNGKIFGYLMTLISPSLEQLGRTSAIHTLFYASPEFPGLGLKLQREMASRLRGSVDELFFRAGPRGDGPRTGVLARRQGAVPDGELFRLELN